MSGFLFLKISRLVLLALSLGILTCLQAISVRAGTQPRRTSAAAEADRKSQASAHTRAGGGTGLSKTPEKAVFSQKALPSQKVPSQTVVNKNSGHISVATD